MVPAKGSECHRVTSKLTGSSTFCQRITNNNENNNNDNIKTNCLILGNSYIYINENDNINKNDLILENYDDEKIITTKTYSYEQKNSHNNFKRTF